MCRWNLEYDICVKIKDNEGLENEDIQMVEEKKGSDSNNYDSNELEKKKYLLYG